MVEFLLVYPDSEQGPAVCCCEYDDDPSIIIGFYIIKAKS